MHACAIAGDIRPLRLRKNVLQSASYAVIAFDCHVVGLRSTGAQMPGEAIMLIFSFLPGLEFWLKQVGPFLAVIRPRWHVG